MRFEGELRPRHLVLGVVAAVVAGAIVITALGRLAGFGEVREALEGGQFGWLAVCAVGQVMVFAGYAGALRSAVGFGDGADLPVGTSVRVVLASFAATQVFAFGGAAGLALVYWVLRRLGRERREAAVLLIGLSTAVYLVFGTIAWVAALVALVLGEAPLGMTVPWLVGLPVLVVAARWFTAPERVGRWTGDRASAGWFGQGLATGVGAAAWVRGRLAGGDVRLFGWAIVYWVGDVASLWAALRAFGAEPGVVTVTAAYTTGYLVQSLPIPLIATAGVDTATTLLLHLLGVPLDLALLGVVAHRVFAFWLPVVPGSVLALTLRSRLGVPAGAGG